MTWYEGHVGKTHAPHSWGCTRYKNGKAYYQCAYCETQMVPGVPHFYRQGFEGALMRERPPCPIHLKDRESPRILHTPRAPGPTTVLDHHIQWFLEGA